MRRNLREPATSLVLRRRASVPAIVGGPRSSSLRLQDRSHAPSNAGPTMSQPNRPPPWRRRSIIDDESRASAPSSRQGRRVTWQRADIAIVRSRRSRPSQDHDRHRRRRRQQDRRLEVEGRSAPVERPRSVRTTPGSKPTVRPAPRPTGMCRVCRTDRPFLVTTVQSNIATLSHCRRLPHQTRVLPAELSRSVRPCPSASQVGY